MAEVGKDSLKCSTCSKWVRFSCSSLTRANFRKICAAGSTMGWNCPACLNGTLPFSPTGGRPPAPSLRFRPLPNPPPHQHVQMWWIRLCLSLRTLPSSTLALFLLSLCLLHHCRPQMRGQFAAKRRTLGGLHAPLRTLEFYGGVLAVFPLASY